MQFEDLLIPIFKKGKKVYTTPSIQQIRKSVRQGLRQFHPGIARFVNPHQYPVGIEKSLFDLKTQLILQIRENHYYQ
jgi:nicotinate phosphoribosyltransferase